MSFYPPTTTIPVYSVLTGVGIVLTSLRFWIRLSYAKDAYARHRIHADDWFILLGLIVVMTCTGMQYYNALAGLSGSGVKKGDAEAKILVEHKISFAMIVIEKIAFGAIKLSLLYFYHRIFGTSHSFRVINYTLMGIVTAWALAFFVADLLLCGKHVNMQWAIDGKLARGKCGDKGLLLIAFAATSVITDLIVLIQPLIYIRRLQLRRKKRIAASFVFLLGGISTFAGVLRLVFLSVSYPIGRLSWGYTAPPQYQMPWVLKAFNPTFFVMVEMCLGIWAANLPAMAPLVRSMSERYKTSSLRSLLSRSNKSSFSEEKGTHLSSYSTVKFWSERKGSGYSTLDVRKVSV